MERTPLKQLQNTTNTPSDGPPSSITAKSLSHTSTNSTEVKENLSQVDAVNVGYGNGKVASNSVSCSATSTMANSTPGAPKTPIRPSGQPSKPATPPLTPMANLKMLIAAASTALEKEAEQQVEAEENKGAEEMGGRKMKSLSVLCKKFLVIAEEIGVGTDFSLESMSKKLGTNRRRIYDIINVLEALEMIVKQSKNWYTWLGQENLLVTLAKMKAMAEDDVDFQNLLQKENSWEYSPSPVPPGSPEPSTNEGAEGGGSYKPEDLGGEETVTTATNSGGGGGGRWDKSLGVLCQKFIMLFLVTPDHEVTLDFAGNILMPDDGAFQTNPKTKVRRLYDIANVLTTLGLIRKKTFLTPNHRKMPGYCWVGPTLDKIESISVFRKSEFNLYPFYKKKCSNESVSRKVPYSSVRPFLHQYEVKEQVRTSSSQQPSSAPSSPVKTKEASFKRSLSFGAGIRGKLHTMNADVKTPKLPPLAMPQPLQKQPVVMGTCKDGTEPNAQVMVPSTPVAPTPTQPANSQYVIARQLYRQVDFQQEVKEFEAELQKTAHRFPRVAPLLHEFVQKLQTTAVEQATGTCSILHRTVEATPTSSSHFELTGSSLLVSPQASSSALSSLSCDSPTNTSGTMSPISFTGSVTPSEKTTPTVLKLTPPTTTGSKQLHTAPALLSIPPVVTTGSTPHVECSIFNPNSFLVNSSGSFTLLAPSTSPTTAALLSLVPLASAGGAAKGSGGSAEDSGAVPSKRARLDTLS